MHGAEHHEDADDRQSKGKLITDHLGSGADSAQKRVLVVRGPAGQHEAVYVQRGDRKHIQQADIEVRNLHRDIITAHPESVGHRYDRKGRQNECKSDQRRHQEVEPADLAGNKHLLHDELGHISEVLDKAAQPDTQNGHPVRPYPVLNESAALPLEPDQDEQEAEGHHDHEQCFGDNN